MPVLDLYRIIQPARISEFFLVKKKMKKKEEKMKQKRDQLEFLSSLAE